MLDLEIKESVDSIIKSRGAEQSSVISILQDIQTQYRYLPEEALDYLSTQLDISSSKIYGIATFYEFFSLEPKGKYIIKICDGTACHVRKSIPILNALRKELDLKEGQNTTDDLLFTVETVSCLGACGLAPVLTINDKVYGSMTPDSTVEVLNQLREENKDEN
ncbi:complex I 24 kDa subunit family protein [Wansuia hejianensis]|uniref:NAD(P)H-dependent oxidoreductase subunit E n=1 Tax=Wansuia hejianensis TaxID=2763667 RepID=A0A926EU48_9FIRM|nr:NAD(P)H-dependent oxidoreductase subunit E [Wansuia hejianensis]MBC8589833.1 NAD(P)H-dependent oxidoreductase subunit E [Wansuia hejianensis]